MKMKLAMSALLATSLSTACFAGPLVKANVDQNAKWLLHIDLDQFRTSKLGQFLINDVIVKQVNALKAEDDSGFLTNMDVVKIIGQLHSLTAYGTSFETGDKFDGLLMLQVEPETRKILEGAAAGLLLNGDGMLTKTNEDGYTYYSMKDEVFASPLENGTILFSRSKGKIKHAASIIAGKSKNLTHSKSFSDFPAVSENFIFLAVAEGFQDNLQIPPEAKVLKQADGARIVLGEKKGDVFVNIALKAKDSEVVTQIRQVVEGIIALGSLSQSENKELQDLIQSIKVTATEKVLSVNAAYPVDSLITRATSMLEDEESKPRHKKHKDHETGEKSKSDKAEKSEAAKTEKAESSASDQ
jgi:hypothetical protein